MKLLQRVTNLPNPYGKSGARMDPFLRIAVCIGTGLGGGILLSWLLNTLPLWAAMILGAVAGMWVVIVLIQTYVWLHDMKNWMRESEARFKGLCGEMERKING